CRVNADFGAVEHLDAEDVEMLRWPGANYFGERGEPDTHQLAPRALFGLLLQQRLIPDLLERHVQRLLVVAAVVREAQRGRIRELVFANEILLPQLHRIDAELIGQNVHPALYGIARFGNPEGAAIRNTAWGLVREVGVHLCMRDREVVAARADAEHAGGISRGIGGSIERAMVGCRRDVERRDLAVRGRSDLHIHVIVPRKTCAREVFRARLNPFDRASDLERTNNRAYVAGIDRHLVAEAAAEIGRNDVDL